MDIVDNFGGHSVNCQPNKRRRSCGENDAALGSNGMFSTLGGQTVRPETPHRSTFIPIDGESGVYFSECWEPDGSTLYFPVSGKLLANMGKYDQITFEQGCFFIGNETGGFHQKAQGQAIHCWRYSDRERRLYIALSYFFSSFQVFQDVVGSLRGL